MIVFFKKKKNRGIIGIFLRKWLFFFFAHFGSLIGHISTLENSGDYSKIGG
jgi:hypothetical protein